MVLQSKRPRSKHSWNPGSCRKRLFLMTLFLLALLINLAMISLTKETSLVWNVVMGGHRALESPEEHEREELDDQEEHQGPLPRVVLMGQFNYGLLPVESIVTWVNSMKRAQFADVIVRGNFMNQTVVDELRTQYGVNVILDQHRESDRENGFFSPYLNLGDVLLKYYNKTRKNHDIDGVLYMHDDALPNLTMISDLLSATKGTSFVGTDLGRPALQNDGSDVSYMNPRTLPSSSEGDGGSSPDHLLPRMAYRIYPKRNSSSGGQFTDFIGNRSYDSFHALDKNLFSWGQRILPRCQGGQWRMANDPRATKYMEREKMKNTDGSEEEKVYLQLPPFTQADFLYVPIDHAEEFAELATLTAKHRIWLECAVPMIVDQIMRMYPQQERVSIAKLCTSFTKWRGKPEMINVCQSRSRDFPDFAVYHPVKLGHNATLWKHYFEEFNEAYLRGVVESKR